MIIPRPETLRRQPGEFVLGSTVRLVAEPGAEDAAALLAEYLGPGRGFGGGGDPVLLGLREEPELGQEGYRLRIRPDGVTLLARRAAGLLRGVQTLRQLLPPALTPSGSPPDLGRWPCLDVLDRPRFGWRGLLLDVARHHMPLDFLYRLTDLVALHKMNVLQLHLTDDQGWRIEIDGWPRLTEVGAWREESMVGPSGSGRWNGLPHGGYYTQAELRGLVRHAAARGVTVVPEIDMPGHARAAIAAYPELGAEPGLRLPVWTDWGVSEDILGVQEHTLDFCRTVLGQVSDVFDSRYVHIGGDECPTVRWRSSPAALRRVAELGLAGTDALRGWFLGQMHEFLAGCGRRTVCWAEGDELPAEVTLTAWRDTESGAAAALRGHRVVMAPHLATYFNYPQSDRADEPMGHPDAVLTLPEVYAFDPAPAGGPVPAERVLGTQGQLWTEFAETPRQVEYQAFPRLCALSEVAWSAGPLDYPDFRRRLVPHLRRLRDLGVRHAPVPRVEAGHETSSVER